MSSGVSNPQPLLSKDTSGLGDRQEEVTLLGPPNKWYTCWMQTQLFLSVVVLSFNIFTMSYVALTYASALSRGFMALGVVFACVALPVCHGSKIRDWDPCITPCGCSRGNSWFSKCNKSFSAIRFATCVWGTMLSAVFVVFILFSFVFDEHISSNTTTHDREDEFLTPFWVPVAIVGACVICCAVSCLVPLLLDQFCAPCRNRSEIIKQEKESERANDALMRKLVESEESVTFGGNPLRNPPPSLSNLTVTV